MRKVAANRWIKACRSGEYAHGKFALVDSKDKFCILGILCNAAPDEVRGEWKECADGTWGMFGESEVLPKPIQKWAGMKSNNGELPDGRNLVELNDDKKLTLRRLANLIEKYWKDL